MFKRRIFRIKKTPGHGQCMECSFDNEVEKSEEYRK